MRIRRLKIRSLADELLRNANISEPPVLIHKIAKSQGVRLFLQPFDGEMSGFIAQKDDNVVIGVNTSHAKVRQRFTIAHELGHMLLHEQGEVHVDRKFHIKLRNNVSSQGVDPDEVEANLFAAEILMPKQFIDHDLQGISDVDLLDTEVIDGLAERYDVSTQAIMFRLVALGYIKA
ncbi:MAG: ImmA/IrrE family metallo-endopeptidase [Chloroflexi bacterium]|nr:ImmA/IrrE family metallo-endopeptidase [Chloroflexota bacterium]